MIKRWLIRWLGFSAMPTPESDAKWAEFERTTRIMLRNLMDNHGHLSAKVAIVERDLVNISDWGAKTTAWMKAQERPKPKAKRKAAKPRPARGIWKLNKL